MEVLNNGNVEGGAKNIVPAKSKRWQQQKTNNTIMLG